MTSTASTSAQNIAQLLETINLRVRVAHFLADFMTENLRALAHARLTGATVVDLYANPDGRERGNRIACYPSSVQVPTVRRHRERIAQLGTLAGRVAQRAEDPEAALIKVESELRNRIRRMRDLDPRLSGVFMTGSGKTYLSGPEQAALDIEGFCWTQSAGNVSAATDIRHNGQAQNYTRNARTHTAHMGASHTLDEAALAASVAEADMIGGRLY